MKTLCMFVLLIAGCATPETPPETPHDRMARCMGTEAPFTDGCELADIDGSGKVTVTDYILLGQTL